MKKYILGSLLAIVVGVLANALWELIKSGVPFLGSAVLAMITLGIDRIRDNIYIGVGRVDLASALIKAMFLMTIGFLINCYAAIKVFRRGFGEFRPWIAFPLTIVSVFLLFGAARHGYVANTRSYFNYLVRASAPYLTSDQRLSIDSRLALVRNKADFDRLVWELKDTLRSHNIEPAAE
jgi:hypothetical protein